MVRIPMDMTHRISISHSIELPFWIPIRSGEYSLPGNVIRKLSLRNDLWLVSIANIIDSRLDHPYEFVVDEIQVSDSEYLENITGGKAQYYHKRKMKTTAIRNTSLLPFEGLFSEEPGSDAWKEQVKKVIEGTHGSHTAERILDDLNELIDRYCVLISVNHRAEEVRHVSLYEALVRIFVTAEAEGVRYSFPTTFIVDMSKADLPFPPYCIPDDEKFDSFQKTLESLEQPAFHQLQWVRTLNHVREKRFQEALLSATQALEALAHNYLKVKGLPKKQIKKQGIASWICGLEDQLSDFFTSPDLTSEYLDYWVKVTCDSVARLWRLRNDVVHNEKVLTKRDIRTIDEGFVSLVNLRKFFLHVIDPDLITQEEEFASLLEEVQIERETDLSRTLTTLKYDWRREEDCYQEPVRSRDDDTPLE